jgi:hypothetical protein
MPPFYIGKTTYKRIIQRGYNGTVTSKRYASIWRQERGEHPELFKTVVLQCFRTDTEAIYREKAIQRFFDVPNNPMFINMAISGGNFGGAAENAPKFGTHLSEATRQKIREKSEGRTASESTRFQMSQTRRGKPKSEETRRRMRKPKSEKHKESMRKAWEIRKAV